MSVKTGRNNKPEVTAPAETLYGHFSDEITWDSERKTAISVRDGVLEYLGLELGMEPADQIFRVYRSPATISNAATAMIGIPLTDEHVELDIEVTNPCGRVLTSEMIDYKDARYDTNLAVQNTIELGDAIKGALATGKRELSLGYKAQLVPHDEYDFEQLKIQPQHLAVVQDGRCGSSCSFIDRKPNHEVSEMKNGNNKGVQKPSKEEQTLAKVFADADGQPNLEQIVEIAQELPTALRKLPMDKLQEVMPALQEIVSMASGASAPSGEGETMDEEVESEESEAMDEEKDDEEKVPMQDTAAFKKAVEQKAKDAAHNAVLQHGKVVEKARKFLGEDYTFSDKSTEQVMRDALATEIDEPFEDSAELKMAFKLLRKTESSTKNFGDEKPNGFDELKDKEL